MVWNWSGIIHLYPVTQSSRRSYDQPRRRDPSSTDRLPHFAIGSQPMTFVFDPMSKSDQNHSVAEMYGFTDFVHVPPKKIHYEAWSTRSSSGCSSGSSPNHLDELHVDIPHSSSASVASTSNTSQHSSDTTVVEAAQAPSFADLKPLSRSACVVNESLNLDVPSTGLQAEVPHASALPSPTQTAFHAVAPSSTTTTLEAVTPTGTKIIRPRPVLPLVDDEASKITHDARFSSYAEFDEAFEAWKKKCLHPFRVASSETLREPDGTVNHRFKYRYVVFHCAHYGEPRMRGIGKRPNQHYLPSGCRAMLRLNYSFAEQLLKITTLHDEHLNHEISLEMYRKVSAKLKRTSIATPSPATKRPKMEALSPGSQDTSLNQQSPLISNSPLQQGSASVGASPLNTQIPSLSHSNQITNMAIALQQQQLMATLISQQKENINMNPDLSGLGMARTAPSMMSILGMMGLHQRMLLQQPAYGLVAPLTQQVSSPPQAQSAPKPQSNGSENEQNDLMKNAQPAAALQKTTLQPNVQQQSDGSDGSPPHLVPEVPLPNQEQQQQQQVPTTTPSAMAAYASFEESLARLRGGAQDVDLMARLAQLNSLRFWGNQSTIPEFRLERHPCQGQPVLQGTIVFQVGPIAIGGGVDLFIVLLN
ncbi:hypothetical protein Q1695_016045 [Nippostrongylus brasiliensis]|nr:hypothetical protein Q1695_016045 [Nippostrongylus brasiliensis]